MMKSAGPCSGGGQMWWCDSSSWP